MLPAEPYLAVCEGALQHAEHGGGQGADAVQGQALLQGAHGAHAARQRLQQLHHGLRATTNTISTPETTAQASFLSQNAPGS